MRLSYILPTIFATVFIIIGVKLLIADTYLKGAGFAITGVTMAALLIWKSRIFKR